MAAKWRLLSHWGCDLLQKSLINGESVVKDLSEGASNVSLPCYGRLNRFALFWRVARCEGGGAGGK